jgi:hypothetical protein
VRIDHSGDGQTEAEQQAGEQARDDQGHVLKPPARGDARTRWPVLWRRTRKSLSGNGVTRERYRRRRGRWCSHCRAGCQIPPVGRL